MGILHTANRFWAVAGGTGVADAAGVFRLRVRGVAAGYL